MNLLANALGESHLNFADAGLLALLGYATVFFGLILLIIVVSVMGAVFIAAEKRKKANQPAHVEAEPVPEVPKPTAPGSAGQLMLHDVEPKTAAMLMAIVADKMGKPLNELRFISIKEVKEK